MSCSIRNAAAADIPWLCNELREFAARYPTNLELYPGDREASAKLAWMIENHIVLVAEDDGVLCGCIAAVVTPHMLNSKIIASQCMWWWVPEVNRGRGIGRHLLAAIVSEARKIADIFSIGVECDSAADTTVMEAAGFRKLERVFALEF